MRGVRPCTPAELQRVRDFEDALSDVHDAQDRWALADAARDASAKAQAVADLIDADDRFNEACDREV